MPYKNIITGQDVTTELRWRAKALRQEMTPAESKLWQRLRSSRLEKYHFRRQQVIGDYIVDFYCHQAALVVEVDGGVHLEQVEYDQRRESCLTSLGLQVLRFTNTDIHQEMEKVLSIILESCRERTNRET